VTPSASYVVRFASVKNEASDLFTASDAGINYSAFRPLSRMILP
jgi:hypothetical protein